MLQFAGEEHFDVGCEELYARLTDLESMTRFVPGMESTRPAGEGKLIGIARPGFSFVRGKLELAMEVFDKEPPRSARMRVHGKGIGNEVEVESKLELEPVPGGGTRLVWSAEVTKLGGLLRSVSKGLIQGAARTLVEHTWSKLRAELSQGGAAAPGPSS